MSVSPQLVVSAASKGDETALTALIGRGADPNARINGTPALTLACANGKTKCAQLLINAGAVVDAPDSIGHTPLIVACTAGVKAIGCVNLLIAKGADVSFGAPDGVTPVLAASRAGGHWSALEQCLKAGASPHKRPDLPTLSPLREARTAYNEDCIQMLMKYKATPDFQWNPFINDWDDFKIGDYSFPKPPKPASMAVQAK